MSAHYSLWAGQFFWKNILEYNKVFINFICILGIFQSCFFICGILKKASMLANMAKIIHHSISLRTQFQRFSNLRLRALTWSIVRTEWKIRVKFGRTDQISWLVLDGYLVGLLSSEIPREWCVHLPLVSFTVSQRNFKDFSGVITEFRQPEHLTPSDGWFLWSRVLIRVPLVEIRPTDKEARFFPLGDAHFYKRLFIRRTEWRRTGQFSLLLSSDRFDWTVFFPIKKQLF